MSNVQRTRVLLRKLPAAALLVILVVTGCADDDGAPDADRPPPEIEVVGDSARLEGFANVTANTHGHTRVVVRQPEPGHAAWLHERGFRFRTFRVDTAAVSPDADALQPDSLRFERDLAPGTLVYTRTSSFSDTSSAVTE